MPELQNVTWMDAKWWDGSVVHEFAPGTFTTINQANTETVIADCDEIIGFSVVIVQNPMS
jgi:hypothetical protein